jgi:hypothetical protein
VAQRRKEIEMIRVYLKPGVKIQKKEGPSGLYETVSGVMVLDAATTPYIIIREELPDVRYLGNEVTVMAERFSWHGNLFTDGTKRVLGQYVWRTAYAELRPCFGGGKTLNDNYVAHIEAKNLSDAVKLYTLIASGNIYPSEPYNMRQVPPPAKNVAEAFRELVRVTMRDARALWYKYTH